MVAQNSSHSVKHDVPSKNPQIVTRQSFLKQLNAVFISKARQNVGLALNAPKPRFWFGDRVMYTMAKDDPNDFTREVEHIYCGTVVGLGWGTDRLYCDQSYESWRYWLELDEEPGEAISNCPVVERELSFVNLPD